MFPSVAAFRGHSYSDVEELGLRFHHGCTDVRLLIAASRAAIGNQAYTNCGVSWGGFARRVCS